MFSDAYTAFAQMVITVSAMVCLVIWAMLQHGPALPPGKGPFDAGGLVGGEQARLNWATLVSLGVGDVVAIDFMQRIFSAKSPETARRACFVAALGTAFVGVGFTMVSLTAGQQARGTPVLFALLHQQAPQWLTMLVLSGIVAASCSTANGAILGTSAVFVRNLCGMRLEEDEQGRSRLLRAVRLTFAPVVAFAVLLAVRVPQTGILLTLAFDVLLASLVVPFVFGLYWPKANAAAAMSAALAGFAVRVGLFALTPVLYGQPNTLLYWPNALVGARFDGWPTFLAPTVALGVFVVVARISTDRTKIEHPSPLPENSQRVEAWRPGEAPASTE